MSRKSQPQYVTQLKKNYNHQWKSKINVINEI